jgi:formamidopyrimidine-DNA glycosylase
MPELPEVETIARDLALVLQGQKVRKARFLNLSIREKGDYRSPDVLEEKRLLGISRRGKNLIFHFSENLAMVCHFKMTGRMVLDSGHNFDKKHLHFFVEFERSRLDYFDVRKFGRISILKEENIQNHPRLKKMGPEPFSINSEQFARIVKKRHKAIKLVLLDQEVVCGLGNIYADESLFDAGIRPTLRPDRISVTRLKHLHVSIKKVLRKAIKKRGSSVDDYIDGFGRTGRFQNMLNVYGRGGETCKECQAPIKRIILGRRSTHLCPRCQK